MKKIEKRRNQTVKQNKIKQNHKMKKKTFLLNQIKPMSKLAKKKKNQKKAKKRKQSDNEITSHTNKIKTKKKYR